MSRRLRFGQKVRPGVLIRRRRPAPRPRAPLDLLVVGAGGMGRAIASLCAQDVDEAGRPRWNVLGFIDEDTALHGSLVDGLPVLGCLRTVTRYPTAQLVVSICHVDHHGARRRIVEALGLPAHRYATVVHSTAVIDPSCRVGRGAVVMPMVCALPGVAIGDHVIVRPQAMMAADVGLRDYATVGAQVFLGRGVVVAENGYVGAGAEVRERTCVGPWVVVGMGSLVLDDVPGHQVWAGRPPKYLGSAPVERLRGCSGESEEAAACE
ncbi:NeuD/PglB/VioB family sugar acetyltransferase [Streptomyces sp. NPDC057909]|uniref:NeuD/PglB/VioB family sugar acetyltransferase n=1 Tax=Streptomyces sp. NPDC057909 TaxID=3346277 RepID=UPI0036E2810E